MSADTELQNVVDEIEEIVPDDMFGSAFDDEDIVEIKDKDETPEPVEDKVDESPKEETEDQNEEDLTALELAEKKAREKFLKKDKPSEDESESGNAPKEERKEEVAEIDFADVDSDPSKYVNSLISNVKNEDQKRRLTETLDSYPEIGEIAAMVARDLVARQKVKYVDGTQPKPEELEQKLSSVETLQKEFAEVKAELAQRRYFDAIEREVPGARAIASSEKFGQWLDKQSVGINTLANSGDPDDAVAVLKAFREHEARAAAKTVDQKQAKQKQKIDSSTKATLKTGRSAGIVDTLADDFEAGFNG